MKRALLAASLGLAPFGFGVAVAEQVLHAQLGSISGDVMVDRGSGFVPAAGDTQLKLGDRILVSSKGGGVLTFGPDCTMALPSDSMITITGTESCNIGTQDGTPGGTNGAGLAIAVVGGVAVTGGAVILNNALTKDEPSPQS